MNGLDDYITDKKVDAADLSETSNATSFATLHNYFGDGASDDNPYSKLVETTNVYKTLTEQDQNDFFEDNDDFDFLFKKNATEYANSELSEEENNRKLFGEFSMQMFYVLPNREEPKGPLSFLKRKLIVQFDAKRKRFLNKMIKSARSWSTQEMESMIAANGWSEDYGLFLNSKLAHEQDNKENDFSRSLHEFKEEKEPNNEEAIQYSKEQFNKDKDWYHLGLRNQMKKKEQFLLEQKLYDEFSLYLSFKRQLHTRKNNTKELADLNEKALQFVDVMYGDGLNENYWGQARYFNLLNKHFPDYKTYLTGQRDIIKSGLTSILSHLLNEVGTLVGSIKEFLKNSVASEQRLSDLLIKIPRNEEIIQNQKCKALEVLSEFAPERKNEFEKIFDDMLTGLNLIVKNIQSKGLTLQHEVIYKKRAIVFLDQMSAHINANAQKLNTRFKVTNVFQLFQPIAELYSTFIKKSNEFHKNLDFNSQIETFKITTNLDLAKLNGQALGNDQSVATIKEDEIKRRVDEIKTVRDKLKLLLVEGTEKNTYQLDYDGLPTNDKDYWSQLVKQSDAVKSKESINVEIRTNGKVKIKERTVDLIVDFLFGNSELKNFDEKLVKLYKADISSIHAIITIIDAGGLEALSNRFRDYKEIYLNETPGYYKEVIKTKAYLISKKAIVQEKFKQWQTAQKKRLERQNIRSVKSAKSKKHKIIIDNYIRDFNSERATSAVTGCSLLTYLDIEFDLIQNAFETLGTDKRIELVNALVENIPTSELETIDSEVLLFFKDVLNLSASNPLEFGSTQRDKVFKAASKRGLNRSNVNDSTLKEKAIAEALLYIKANPNQKGAMYDFAGYHSGEPGEPIDCSGMVSQCVHMAGGGYLNSVPTINGNRNTKLNGVANIINQSNVWQIDPFEIRRGDLVTMSKRKMYNGIPVGHIAFITSVKRDETGKIESVELYHSRGSTGPIAQKLDFSSSDSYYQLFGKTFNYWRFKSGNVKANSKKKKRTNPVANPLFSDYSDKSLPATVDFIKGKKYVKNLTKEQLANLWAFVAEIEKHGITDHKDIAAILAVVSKESNFIPKTEKMNYSKGRLAETWGVFSKTGSRVDRHEGAKNYNKLAEQYAGKPKELANFVYGGKQHNNKNNDGWNYRGRGYNQITFKAKYEDHGKRMGIDLLSNPALLNRKDIAANIAVHFMLKGMKALKSENSLEEYGADGINDFPDLTSAVFAYYHCNTGPYKPVDDILCKVEDEDSGMVRAQRRAPFLKQLLDQRNTNGFNDVDAHHNVETPQKEIPSFNWKDNAPDINVQKDNGLTAYEIKANPVDTEITDERTWENMQDEFREWYRSLNPMELNYDKVDVGVSGYWKSQGKTYNCDLYAKKIIDGQAKEYPEKFKDIGSIKSNKTKGSHSFHMMWEKEHEKGTKRKQGKKHANDISTLEMDHEERLFTIQYIHACLEQGIPAQVGVNHTFAYYNARGNADKTTDHWLVINGKGSDEKGNYFTYLDPGRSTKTKGTSETDNRLYQDKQNEWIWKDDKVYKKLSYILVATTLYSEHRNKDEFSLGRFNFERKTADESE
ncbi:MAG: hypothetical protein GQ574_02665 [Crocinitomix sp.]|nr:hypothetical protein [Crocinitomix sp.]